MLKPGPLPRVICPVCRRAVPVRTNGALREHRYTLHPRGKCKGSGMITGRQRRLAQSWREEPAR